MHIWFLEFTSFLRLFITAIQWEVGSHFLEYCCHAFIDFVCRDLAFWFVSNEILGGLNTLAKQVFCFGWIDDMLC